MAAADDPNSASPDLLRFEAGKIVFREGDPGDTVYVVLDGKVDLRVKGHLVETVGPGGILGEMALIEQAPRVASATARTGCDLLPISEERFMSMIQKTPHFALQIMKVIASRLRRMNVRLTKQKKSPKKPSAKQKKRSPRAARRRTSRR
jgi:CRP-like cAMP-binding protein